MCIQIRVDLLKPLCQGDPKPSAPLLGVEQTLCPDIWVLHSNSSLGSGVTWSKLLTLSEPWFPLSRKQKYFLGANSGKHLTTTRGENTL